MMRAEEAKAVSDKRGKVTARTIQRREKAQQEAELAMQREGLRNATMMEIETKIRMAAEVGQSSVTHTLQQKIREDKDLCAQIVEELGRAGYSVEVNEGEMDDVIPIPYMTLQVGW